ncbi:MAG TPA: hypothetical protein VK957_19430 [Lunatimonas sp.]|nr:hypothetical protein [Lunatimonas sp.]
MISIIYFSLYSHVEDWAKKIKEGRNVDNETCLKQVFGEIEIVSISITLLFFVQVAFSQNTHKNYL